MDKLKGQQVGKKSPFDVQLKRVVKEKKSDDQSGIETPELRSRQGTLENFSQRESTRLEQIQREDRGSGSGERRDSIVTVHQSTTGPGGQRGSISFNRVIRT